LNYYKHCGTVIPRDTLHEAYVSYDSIRTRPEERQSSSDDGGGAGSGVDSTTSGSSTSPLLRLKDNSLWLASARSGTNSSPSSSSSSSTSKRKQNSLSFYFRLRIVSSKSIPKNELWLSSHLAHNFGSDICGSFIAELRLVPSWSTSLGEDSVVGVEGAPPAAAKPSGRGGTGLKSASQSRQSAHVERSRAPPPEQVLQCLCIEDGSMNILSTSPMQQHLAPRLCSKAHLELLGGTAAGLLTRNLPEDVMANVADSLRILCGTVPRLVAVNEVFTLPLALWPAGFEFLARMERNGQVRFEASSVAPQQPAGIALNNSGAMSSYNATSSGGALGGTEPGVVKNPLTLPAASSAAHRFLVGRHVKTAGTDAYSQQGGTETTEASFGAATRAPGGTSSRAAQGNDPAGSSILEAGAAAASRSAASRTHHLPPKPKAKLLPWMSRQKP
ncbi:unnamed protein product, partial [Amoebophrya sp. A120]